MNFALTANSPRRMHIANFQQNLEFCMFWWFFMAIFRVNMKENLQWNGKWEGPSYQAWRPNPFVSVSLTPVDHVLSVNPHRHEPHVGDTDPGLVLLEIPSHLMQAPHLELLDLPLPATSTSRELMIDQNITADWHRQLSEACVRKWKWINGPFHTFFHKYILVGLIS